MALVAACALSAVRVASFRAPASFPTAAVIRARRTPLAPRLQPSRLPVRRSLAVIAAAASDEGAKGNAGYCVSIKVGGMVCGGCSTRVEEALKEAPGVTQAEVDLDKGTALVTLSAAAEPDPKAALAKLKKMIEDLGFEAALAA